jgi:hypothetical protein
MAMENDKHDTAAATKIVNAKSTSVSKKSGLIQAIRRSLAAPKPSIKAIDALAEVQSPTQEPQRHETIREAGIAGDIYKLDDQDCGGPAR